MLHIQKNLSKYNVICKEYLQIIQYKYCIYKLNIKKVEIYIHYLSNIYNKTIKTYVQYIKLG